MEIIKVKEGNIDKMAEKVFWESINLLGGLKKLAEYRNLTWLPSLAEASYAVVLKYEAAKTNREIAEFLGITEQTVKNMLSADEEKVMKYLKGELDEKPNEHTAGGIAKYAYKKLKEEGRLDIENVEIREEEMKILDIDWAVYILSKIRGKKFPLDKEQLYEILDDIKIKGVSAKEIIENIECPIKSPADLLHKIKEYLKKNEDQ